MAQWQRHLNIKDVWDSGDVQLIAKTLSERLRALRPFGDEHLDYIRDEIAENFDDIANDPEAGISDFDCIMQDLYDWGDARLDDKWSGRKVCWIATF